MSVVPIVAGTLAACLVAWGAITAFAWFGETRLDMRLLRFFGAAALASLAVSVAGVSVPWVLAPALLGVGLLSAFAVPRLPSA